jgi:hypothetical protein
MARYPLIGLKWPVCLLTALPRCFPAISIKNFAKWLAWLTNQVPRLTRSLNLHRTLTACLSLTYSLRSPCLPNQAIKLIQLAISAELGGCFDIDYCLPLFGPTAWTFPISFR